MACLIAGLKGGVWCLNWGWFRQGVCLCNLCRALVSMFARTKTAFAVCVSASLYDDVVLLFRTAHTPPLRPHFERMRNEANGDAHSYTTVLCVCRRISNQQPVPVIRITRRTQPSANGWLFAAQSYIIFIGVCLRLWDCTLRVKHLSANWVYLVPIHTRNHFARITKVRLHNSSWALTVKDLETTFSYYFFPQPPCHTFL